MYGSSGPLEGNAVAMNDTGHRLTRVSPPPSGSPSLSRLPTDLTSVVNSDWCRPGQRWGGTGAGPCRGRKGPSKGRSSGRTSASRD